MTTLNRPCLSSRNEPRNIAVARSRETLGMWLVMSIWKADDPTENLTQQGENDWVLQRKMGDTTLAIIVVGKGSA